MLTDFIIKSTIYNLLILLVFTMLVSMVLQGQMRQAADAGQMFAQMTNLVFITALDADNRGITALADAPDMQILQLQTMV